MKNLPEIQEILSAHLETLATQYKVGKIGIFGSAVKGKRRKRSDIDMLVEFTEPVDFFHFLDLEEFLQTLLGAKVDLVTKNALKPHIGKHILEEVVYL
ncbi:MAG: nucleotidyltransferase family protein [Deltaproteobacteria bacterium]|nr:nucleotidyltransferase family protein [Deltaproteobacteria bacterium]